jgi:hypothetical protein
MREWVFILFLGWITKRTDCGSGAQGIHLAFICKEIAESRMNEDTRRRASL